MTSKLPVPAYLSFVAALTVLAFCWVAPSGAQNRTPLPQAGKKTLYQRVVSHPGAVLYSAPDKTSKVVNPAVKPFTVYYVYGRNGEWLEVGTSSVSAEGWIEAAGSTEWKQALTLLFTPRTDRMPVLFFKDKDGIVKICSSQALGADLGKVLAQAEAARSGKPDPDLPVVAMESADKEGAVSQKRFYLMPILQMEDPFEGVKLLRVASVDPGESKSPVKKPEALRTGIAFVIDTTISMRPYIQQSLEVIRGIYNSVEKSPVADKVAFAVIAYRNSVQASPGLEYLTRIVSDFRDARGRQEFEAALSAVDEAKASSHSFDEDAMAGVKAAIEKLSWEPYAGRVVVVITDAGPIPGHDVHSSTKMGVEEIADMARSKNIFLTTAHIKSPSGKRNHESAEKAYRQLTRLQDNQSAYLEIQAAGPAEGARTFADGASRLAQEFVKLAAVAAEGGMMPKPQESAESVSPEKKAEHLGQALGYAIQLEYLGQQRGNRAPQVLSSWIADMDLSLLSKGRQSPSVQVAVLMTKNQLSDLQKQLKIIIDQAERTKKTDSKDFFQSIISASGQVAKDPAAFSKKPNANLQQLGLLGEFLDDLPYKSDVMLLREEDWYRMSVGEQTSFINRLKSRIVRYEEYDRDVANWESFGSTNSMDWVYRVPMTMLP
jgi:serine/threonine-protein kinase PpkA